jgi:hypothetical protein
VSIRPTTRRASWACTPRRRRLRSARRSDTWRGRGGVRAGAPFAARTTRGVSARHLLRTRVDA